MKIVFLDKSTLANEIDLSFFNELGDFHEFETTDPEIVTSRIHDCDIIITNKVVLNEANLKDASKLKLIHIAATGMNNIDLEFCKKVGIEVKNVANYSTKSVVQHTFSMLFYLLSSMRYFDDYTKNSDWTKSHVFTHQGRSFNEITGKTWGIIGLGNIGREVANIAQAFGLNIIYYSTSGNNKTTNFERVELEELLKTSDIISLHCPLNEKTQDLIHSKNITHIKSNAIVLNLARGGIINEVALVDYFQKTQLLIGLDVLEKEPMAINSPIIKILKSPRVLVTPHIAWASLQAQQSLVQTIFDNIKLFQVK